MFDGNEIDCACEVAYSPLSALACHSPQKGKAKFVLMKLNALINQKAKARFDLWKVKDIF